MTPSAARQRRPRTSAGGPDRTRRLAFDVLRLVHADGAYANLALARLLSERGLTGRDAAFATELVAGTCRMEGTYDRIIKVAAGRALGSLQPAVVDLLRLGSHQLLSMRVAGHAAVSATVELAAATVGPRVRGLVNAVLRRVADRDYEGWVEVLTKDADRLDSLAIRYAHPRWVVEGYAGRLPDNELHPALAANNIPPVTSLAIRPGLATVSELLEAGAQPGRHSPYAAGWDGNPGDLLAVREGRAGVQDEGSQLAALGLARMASQPGWWLDLCSGPGGKAALLAGLVRADGSRLLCAELSQHRAGLVAGAVRGYPEPPDVVVADATLPAWRGGGFSRVLADVPCTGLGALRRRPEARWRRTADDLAELKPLQRRLLHSALEAARPGGAVAYVTCSPHRQETSDVVESVLADRVDVVLEDAAGLFPDLHDASDGPFLQLWTHRHGTDAMFAAYLRKRHRPER